MHLTEMYGVKVNMKKTAKRIMNSRHDIKRVSSYSECIKYKVWDHICVLISIGVFRTISKIYDEAKRS